MAMVYWECGLFLWRWVSWSWWRIAHQALGGEGIGSRARPPTFEQRSTSCFLGIWVGSMRWGLGLARAKLHGSLSRPELPSGRSASPTTGRGDRHPHWGPRSYIPAPESDGVRPGAQHPP